MHSIALLVMYPVVSCEDEATPEMCGVDDALLLESHTNSGIAAMEVEGGDSECNIEDSGGELAATSCASCTFSMLSNVFLILHCIPLFDTKMGFPRRQLLLLRRCTTLHGTAFQVIRFCQSQKLAMAPWKLRASVSFMVDFLCH